MTLRDEIDVDLVEQRAADRIKIADPDIGAAERKKVVEVLRSGMLADGEVVRSFENEFAAYCETSNAVATSNGTTALHAALNALGISNGDRVLTTPFSFVASANAIRLCNATPVFADIDPKTFNLDPHAVEATLRESGKSVDAILVVHLFGLPAQMDHLVELATEYDVVLIEDGAQAHGSTFQGQPVGSFGDAACFSFYPTKNMTTGEGGMVTTDCEETARQVASFINHGRPVDDTHGYDHVRVGHNFRLTNVAAAIGRVQLQKLDMYNDARRANAARLCESLDGSTIEAPNEPDYANHVYHQFTVRCNDRDSFSGHLDDYGVGTAVYYPTPIHKLSVYNDNSWNMPTAERAASEVLSLPVHPKLTESELETIEIAIKKYDQ